MGIETALIVGAVVSLTSSVAGGIAANSAAKKQAKAIGAEATEAVRVKENEVTDFMGEQTAGFSKSGVDLSQASSAFDILESTRAEGDKQISEIKRQGKAQQQAARSAGRAALIGGIGQGISSVATMYAASGKVGKK